jgi:hypothetical protein
MQLASVAVSGLDETDIEESHCLQQLGITFQLVCYIEFIEAVGGGKSEASMASRFSVSRSVRVRTGLISLTPFCVRFTTCGGDRGSIFEP